MSLDLYALCPCGSGKKLKFCTKCRDSVGELEKIVKLIEGNQLVAALDRCNSLLEQYPTAAWLYAVKGRLLMGLREYDALRENADRFLRLQPTNPLALTQRAAYLSTKNELTQAADSLLEALAESGEQVDTFVIDVCSGMALSLLGDHNLLSARMFAILPLLAENHDGARAAAYAMSQMNQSGSVNNFLKWLPESPDVPAGQPWTERLSEAVRLLDSQKIHQAESKLQSLDQQVGGQESILIGLLTCAIWRADVTDQQKLLRRLSELESLDQESRARYLAMSVLVDPEAKLIGEEIAELGWEVEDLDPIVEAFTAHDRTIALPPELVRSFAEQEGDGPPPRAGFQLLDRDKVTGDSLPPPEQMPEVYANVLIYGRQTDRKPLIVALGVPKRHQQAAHELVAEVTQLELGEPQRLRTTFLPLSEALNGTPPVLRITASRAEVLRIQRDLFIERMPQRVAAMPLGLFDGKSLEEVAADDGHALNRLALIRTLEQYEACQSTPEAMDRLRQIAKVEALPTTRLEGRHPQDVPIYELNQLEAAGLSVDQLAALLERARGVNCPAAIRRFAERLIALDPGGQLAPAKMLAYLSLAELSDDPAEAISTLEQGKAWASRIDTVNDAPFLLSELQYQLLLSNAEGFRATVQALTSNYSNDPQVMTQLQQILMQFGLINPDGSPRSMPPGGPPEAPAPGAAPAAAPAAQSGLWTPDAPAPPSPGPAAGGDAGGGSGKIWLPGMD